MQSHAKYLVSGMVQGVGFRPFVYRLAQKHALSGHVSLTPLGAEVEVEGDPAQLEAFFHSLLHAPPAHARIRDVRTVLLPPAGLRGFTVVAPRGALRESHAPIPPDLGLCPTCRGELSDPGDRRYGYPFISCAQCGPRYTIAREVPHDREQTTLGTFDLCEDCRQEHEDPGDRRFQAFPTGCPACGPKVWMEGGEEDLEGGLYHRLASLLGSGRVVAFKGVGGFTLVADARNPQAVARLRRKKGEPHKPFGVLARDLLEARSLAIVGAREAALLEGPERPSVLLHRSASCALAPGVAPGLPTLAVGLPSSGFETLLFEEGAPSVLVRTSGNRAGDPPVWTNDEARSRLPVMSDALLLHDQEIAEPCEDSIVAPVSTGAIVVRRSRGFAPAPVLLASSSPRPIVALGTGRGGSACVVSGREAYLSPHLPPLKGERSRAHFDRTIKHLSLLLGVAPQVVAYDPEAAPLASEWAERRERMARREVFHAHAHAVQGLAAAGERGPALSIVLDACSKGTDGTLWGGEVLLATDRTWKRVAHLKPVDRPGATLVERDPWRMAFAYLKDAFGWSMPRLPISFLRDRARSGLMRRTYEGPAPLERTSSAERLLEGIAVLVGVKDRTRYPGEPLLQLDAKVGEVPAGTPPYPFAIERASRSAPRVVRLEETFRALAADLERGRPGPDVARRCLVTLAQAFAEVLEAIRAEGGPSMVTLAGSAFSMGSLFQTFAERLDGKGFTLLKPKSVPPGEGGLALGQAVIAAAQLGSNGHGRGNHGHPQGGNGSPT